MKLQSVGEVESVQAKDLCVGDTVMFNFGLTHKVVSVTEISPAFVQIVWSSGATQRVKKTKEMAKV